MRSRKLIRWVASSACVASALLQVVPAQADEPGRLGRFFRFGAASETSKPASSSAAASSLATSTPPGYSGMAAPYRSVADTYSSPAISTPVSTANGTNSLTPQPRITPKSRINKPITEADPLVTRLAVGRADGGSQFGMFMQVFADGTIIDGEGVHKVSADVMKPVIEAVSSNDFAKLKGHCGGPAGDTFENFHVVTYERAYGRLRANAFSYSGNPQGCDHAVHQLHKILDELQMKMSTPSGMGNATASMTPTVAAPMMTPSVDSPAPSLVPLDAPAPMATTNSLLMPTLPDPGQH